VSPTAPPVVQPYDRRWPAIAERLIDDLRQATRAHPDWRFDHIGSTSVRGLAAKNIIDLQVRVPTLPSYQALDDLLGPLGYEQALGARPDSPGVHRDSPRGSQDVPADVWEKRLYVRDGEPPVILHIRRADSPFGLHTVWFRDWLRAHDDQRDRYAAAKQRIAAAHAGDADYDDYTRDKTGYLDEVHPLFERWARERT
jgi:GrpB-like predicted nucleotidyltransferase (UPF0157 family)